MSEEAIKQEKFKVGLVFLIGLAFFATEVVWNMYDSQVSILLKNKFLLSALIVGIILGIDNLMGAIIQPIMGNISDNTRTRLGRRMPYIIVGIPLGALFFILIAFQTTLIGVIILIFLFIFAMSFFRSQAVALMPDFIILEHRSKANSIINMMGALSVVVAAVISGLLVDISLQLAFITVAIIMIISLIILILTIKEKNSFSYQLLLKMEAEIGEKVKDKKEKSSLMTSLKDIAKEEDKSTLFALLAIFALSLGYYGVRAFVTVYATIILGATPGQAGFLLFYVGLTFIIAAFPLAILAEKFGRRLFIKIGLAIFASALILGYFFQTMEFIIFVLILVGIGYACVIVNTIVLIWGMAPSAKKIGTYTGVYYAFSFSAAFLGPIIFGAFMDWIGWNYFMLVCAFFLIISFILMFFVKREVAELSEEEKLAKRKAIQELY
ncbi:MAG: MFS transporter [Candidatus Hodarchaeota archaeon]